MIDTALSLAGAPIEILLYLNEDDPELEKYQYLIDSKHIIVGPDRSPVFSWNKLAENAKYDILMLQGDDAWFETNNWALKVIEAFEQYPDKIVFVYPDLEGYPWKGGYLTADHCPHFFIHRNWIDTVGYFVAPHFWHWYVDTWWRDVAKIIDRRHIIKDLKIPLLVDFDDITDHRKDMLCNRERDHWLWSRTQQWLQNDAIALLQKINIRT